MNIQGAVNTINEISLRIESIDSSLKTISKDINNLYIFFQQYTPQLFQLSQKGFLDKYGTAVFGFLGVIVGAYITYHFNKRISREERIGRVAIQRKNLIYAPIYKELLQLIKYIKQHSQNCYLHILTKTEDRYNEWKRGYYYDKERCEGACFVVWNEMKEDVRKDYVPMTIQESLEEINKNFKIYNENRDKINSDFEGVFKKYKINELYGEADRKKFNKQKIDTKISLPTPTFLFKKDGNLSEGLREVYEQYGDFSHEAYADFKKSLEEFFKKLPQEINRIDFFESYDKLVNSVLEAHKKVEGLIAHIVNTYEFGDKLKEI